MTGYRVEAFDSSGRDVLPPRTVIIVSDINTAEAEVASVCFSPVSYYVITRLEDATPESQVHGKDYFENQTLEGWTNPSVAG